MLDDSLRQNGAGRSILVDKHGNVIAGNKTQERAVDLGLTDAIVVQTDGKQIVVVQRTDIDLDTPEGRRLAIADNRVGQVDLNWNPEALKELEAGGVDLEQFWFPDELADLLNAPNEDEQGGDPSAAMSRAEEWRDKWDVQAGHLWQIGRHRLLCGSAYDKEAITRLLDGRSPDLLHIDPPYGIGIVQEANKSIQRKSSDWSSPKTISLTNGNKKQKPGFSRTGAIASPTTDAAFRTGSTMRRSRKAIIVQPNLYPVMQNDDHPFDPHEFLDVAPIVVMWGANYYADRLPAKSGWIIWDKREGITRNHFADCELAWTNQDKPSRIFYHLWNGLHRGSQVGQARYHPTEKPIALFEEIGKLLADGGLWLDLFAGSGPQFIAAENTGATCYGAEIEILYAAMILERLSKIGLSPVRVDA